MAPAHSLARLRKHVLDRVARREVTMVEAARQLGCSRSRLYELKDRYERYGEAGLFPKPRPGGTHPATVSPALRDQIVAYASSTRPRGRGRSPLSWSSRGSAGGGSVTRRSTTCFKRPG